MRRLLLSVAATVAAVAVSGCGPSSSCYGGSAKCGEVCVELTSDNLNCGACGTACAAGQVCSARTCSLSCQSSLANCSGSCRDTQTDLANCGACGTACAAGQVCSAGTCSLSCQSGLANCSGSCRDTQTDRANCGACGTACAAGRVCSAGACALSCQAGLTSCSGVCRDVQTDRHNCGACGNVCGEFQICSAGACAKTRIVFIGAGNMASVVPSSLFDKVVLGYPMDAGKLSQMSTAHVVVIGRYATQWSVMTPEFRAALDAFSRAGGSVVTEWDGLSIFLSGYDSTYRYPTGVVAPLEWFNGVVGAGGLLAAGTPVTQANTADPIFLGMANPFSGAGATEFFFTTYNTVGTELEVLATFAGDGSVNFPVGPHPTILRGRRCGGNVIFMTSDVQDAPALLGPLVENAMIAASTAGTGTTTDVCPVCGDGIRQPGEDFDPPPGPFASAPVTAPKCWYDFSAVAQLYCSGGCSWAGANGCDQADADIFCKLKTGNPLSTATSFVTGTALAQPGFSCGSVALGVNLGPMPVRGVYVNVWYQDSSILANHGPGTVITTVSCTNP